MFQNIISLFLVQFSTVTELIFITIKIFISEVGFNAIFYINRLPYVNDFIVFIKKIDADLYFLFFEPAFVFLPLF